MGTWDDLFDFNHDGKLDALEWSAKMEFWDEISKDHSSEYNKVSGGARRLKSGTGSPAYGRRSTSAGTGTRRAQEEKEEKIQINPAVWAYLKLFLAFGCFLIGYFAFMGIRHTMARNAEVGRVKSLVDAYREEVPAELPAHCKVRGIGLKGSYTAEGFPEMTLSPGSGGKYRFYGVTLDYAVTLHAGESFDRLDDRAKYDKLGELYRMAEAAHAEFMQASFPEFAQLTGFGPVEGLSISYRGAEREVYIQTPAHLYQYSKMYDDLFILDGESYFLEDEQSRWTK